MLGIFKDEVDGKNYDRIFRTAPHTLCFILHGDEKLYKKYKGTGKNTVKRTGGHDNYNQALENHEVTQGHLTVLGVNAIRYIVLILQE